MPTRIALYAQATPSDPQCEIQLRNLREYSARQGGVLVREYVDIDAGRSASPPLRPSRGQLRKDAHSGQFDLICVWHLENWNCGSVFASLATIREFLSRGQCFVAVADRMHLERSNRDWQLVLSTLTACAAWERQARQRGVPLRSKRGAGRGRQWTVAERATLWQLSALGRSVRQLAAQLGLSRSAVHRELQSMRSEQSQFGSGDGYPGV